jgi:O-antigen ligase
MNAIQPITTTTHTFAPAMPVDVEPPPLLKFSFLCFCIFNLAFYSRLFDWHFSWLHVPLITSLIALLGAAMEGRLITVFTTKIGMCMAILTALYVVNIPFSSWMGGSMGVFTGDWVKTVMAFAIAAALIFNFRQCCTALYSIGWGSGIAGLLVSGRGKAAYGDRLTLSGGTLGNANEVAFDLLLGLPFLWLILQDSRSGRLKKFFAVCLIINGIVALLRTGSRGGLIGFATLNLLLFIRSSFGGKIVMALVGIVVVAGALVVLPHSLKLRYATLVMGSGAVENAQSTLEASGVDSAAESYAARRALLINSLKLTISHPIFGVGIGQFSPFMAGIEAAEGRHSGWQGTHNTYTQISSEAGIPALIVFVCMIVFSITGVAAIAKRARKIRWRGKEVMDVINVSSAMVATLIVYAVCVCFDYVAYSATLPVLSGLAISLIRCGNVEVARLQSAPVQHAPGQFVTQYPLRMPRPLRPAAF